MLNPLYIQPYEIALPSKPSRVKVCDLSQTVEQELVLKKMVIIEGFV